MRISDWSSDVCSSDPRKKRRKERRTNGAMPAGFVTAAFMAGAGRGTAAAHAMKCARLMRSEEHTSELQSLMRISYAVFCLKKKTKKLHQRLDIQRIHKLNIHKSKQNNTNHDNLRT